MPRAIWKGSISFGLVNIPVGLYGAEKRDEVHFNLLDQRNMAPIHYQRINSETGKEVPWEDTVRGYQFEEGRYVVLSDADLERANPQATQTVDITDFVDLAEIHPIYFDRPYYLAPEKNGAKGYALLREILRRTGKAGIAKVVIRTRQYLAAVVPMGDVIVLELMRFAHELRDLAELDLPSGKQGLSEKELKMAEKLVEGMIEKWDPEKYRDDYQADLMHLIDERVKAGQLEAPAEAAPPRRPQRGKVIDLMTLLKRSVEEGGGRKDAKRSPAPARSGAAAQEPAHRPARTAARRPPARRTTGKRQAGARKQSA
jgi:DNA end-binding protein Ku